MLGRGIGLGLSDGDGGLAGRAHAVRLVAGSLGGRLVRGRGGLRAFRLAGLGRPGLAHLHENARCETLGRLVASGGGRDPVGSAGSLAVIVDVRLTAGGRERSQRNGDGRSLRQRGCRSSGDRRRVRGRSRRIRGGGAVLALRCRSRLICLIGL